MNIIWLIFRCSSQDTQTGNAYSIRDCTTLASILFIVALGPQTLGNILVKTVIVLSTFYSISSLSWFWLDVCYLVRTVCLSSRFRLASDFSGTNSRCFDVHRRALRLSGYDQSNVVGKSDGCLFLGQIYFA